MLHSAEATGRRHAAFVRVWYVLAAGGLALLSAHNLTGFGGPSVDDFFNRTIYNALILLALAGCALRVVWVRTARGAWLALTGSVAVWAVAEIVYDFAYNGSPPFPSVADVFYLAFYPLCYVGLILLVRSHAAKLNGSVWLDGAMASLAAAAVGAAVLFEAVLASTNGSPAAVVTNLAYPLGDIILLSLVIGVFALTGWRPGRVWLLIGGALAASAVADGIFLFQTASNSYVEGTILDALWPASMLLLAAAAWQPAARGGTIELEGRPLLGTPAACGVIAIGVLMYDRYHHLHELGPALAVATLVAVLMRTGLTFRENGRILTRIRRQAVTDALTGLDNRRKLFADLDQALADGAHSEPRILVIFDLDGFKHYNDTFGHPAGDVLLVHLGAKLAAVAAPHGSSYRLGGDEFCVLARIPEKGAATLLDETAAALTEVGEGFAVGTSFGAVFLPEEAADPSEALSVADQRLYAQKHSAGLGRSQPHEALLQALFEREPDIRGHVRDVTELSLELGRRFNFDAKQTEELRMAAQLHDIGKLAIPDAVLRKHGELDENEWEFVRQHTLIGERILGAVPALRSVAKIVRASHERWDGGGYSDGLAGEDIPLPARIIAVCDAYAVMTSDRPYRDAVSSAEAVDELRRCAGTQFDPRIVDVFCDFVARAPLAQAS
jgi:two-component system cell cycle response regulator